MTTLHKITLGCLGLSTLVNAFLTLTTRTTMNSTQTIITQTRRDAESRIKVAEARADNLLVRINTSERLHVEPGTPQTVPLSEKKPYISDFPYDDEAWQDHVDTTPPNEPEA